MGNYLALNMEENFQQNQDFITEMNTIKVERHLQMQNQMRERQVALDIARSRELFYWYGAFYLTSIAWAVAAYKYRRRRTFFLPLIPLSFIMAYQTDLAYGNKLHRIRVEADHIMQFEKELLELPLGLPTAASLDLGRIESDEQRKLHPMVPL